MATGASHSAAPIIRTPDQRLRIFISSTLGELAAERIAVRAAIERLHLAPVMFEDGARPHAPRSLYRAYLDQSHVFVGIYWQRYGWIAPGEDVSGLEDEYRLAGDRPRLLYIKEPAPQREERLGALIGQFEAHDQASYKRFTSIDQLVGLIERDLALLLSERFEAATARASAPPPAATPVPLTKTHGRHSEIRAVQELLASGTRLLTLTGPGGVGKTRLAQAAALSLAADYPDGISFVPLETVTAGAMVGARHRRPARRPHRRQLVARGSARPSPERPPCVAGARQSRTGRWHRARRPADAGTQPGPADSRHQPPCAAGRRRTGIADRAAAGAGRRRGDGRSTGHRSVYGSRPQR